MNRFRFIPAVCMALSLGIASAQPQGDMQAMLSARVQQMVGGLEKRMALNEEQKFMLEATFQQSFEQMWTARMNGQMEQMASITEKRNAAVKEILRDSVNYQAYLGYMEEMRAQRPGGGPGGPGGPPPGGEGRPRNMKETPPADSPKKP